ncbi:MAG: SAM-dependent chlorinase/fluorinase [Deltaproteobacteria bacterium]|nr:SAM-dependent chlorinase/fluorinase [Deltaproteobacteria bacterium]
MAKAVSVSPRPRLISLLTDFGTRDAFAGIMKGVILSINPAASLVDLSHDVPPQDILAGALILRSAAAFFPPGTIHVAVVDPGVGSARRALLIETRSAFFVGPDNGLLSLAAPPETVRRIVHLTNAEYFLSPRSHTFHGRDVFAPVAAHLSLGIAPEQFGPPVTTMERVALPVVERGEAGLTGSVIYIDHFGNLLTNITEADLRPFSKESLLVSIDAVRIHGVVAPYAAVAVGAPAALINSWGMLEIAVRNGSAAQRFGVLPGCPVYLTTS